MKRNFAKKYSVLLGSLLISGLLYSCGPDLNDSIIDTFKLERTKNIHINSSDTSALVPEEASAIKTEDASYGPDSTAPNLKSKSSYYTPTSSKTELYDYTLMVRARSITLGESIDNVINKYGVPNRVVDTEYDFDYYVYNNDYTKLLLIAVQNNLVVGFYSDSIDLSFRGIEYGSNLNSVNRILNQSNALEEVITYKTDSYTLKILMDKLETQLVTGVYVLSNNVKVTDYTPSVKRNVELLVYDLTNSVRARNAVPILSWSTSAAIASRKHSHDMAINRYFSHTSIDGAGPGDRLSAEGIYHTSYGENIIGGYGTAILSNHGWFNSPGHRKTLLNANYRYLGVGFVYDEESHYKTYITQNFYR